MLYPHEELKEVTAPRIPKSKRVYGIGKKTLKKATNIGKGIGKKGISAAKTTTKVVVEASKYVDVGAIPEFEGYPKIKKPRTKTTKTKKRVASKIRMKTVIVDGIKIQVPVTTKTKRKKPKKTTKTRRKTTTRRKPIAKRPLSIFGQLGI